MKQKIRSYFLGFLSATLLLISLNVYASDIFSTISVVLNKVNVSLEGNIVGPAGGNYQLSNGVQVPYSILYKGTTYLPMRKLAELLGKDVTWNSNGNIAAIGGTALPSASPSATAIPTPTPTPSAPTAPPPTQSGTPSTGAGTIGNPVNIGAPFGYHNVYNDATTGTGRSSDVSITVHAVQPVTLQQVSAMGVQFIGSDAASRQYYLVDLEYNVANPYNKSGVAVKYNDFRPDSWGTRDSTYTRSVIGGTEFNFDNAIGSKFNLQMSGKTIPANSYGETVNVRGSAIIVGTAGYINYLAYTNEDETMEYRSSFYYFKLAP